MNSKLQSCKVLKLNRNEDNHGIRFAFAIKTMKYNKMKGGSLIKLTNSKRGSHLLLCNYPNTLNNKSALFEMT